MTVSLDSTTGTVTKEEYLRLMLFPFSIPQLKSKCHSLVKKPVIWTHRMAQKTGEGRWGDGEEELLDKLDLG